MENKEAPSRLSLEQWRDKIAQTIHVRPEMMSKFSSFKDIRGSTYVKKSVELQALQAYHDQEVEWYKKELADKIPRWVSVESKPEFSGYYLVLYAQFGFNGQYQEVCAYYHLEDKWRFFNNENKGFEITHWMPLPQSPTN